MHEVWLADDLADDRAAPIVAAARRPRDGARAAAPREDVERESGTATPQGALAIVADLATTPPAVARARRGLALLLDRVQDPGNVGAVFRVAAAFSAAGVLVGEGSADPLAAEGAARLRGDGARGAVRARERRRAPRGGARRAAPACGCSTRRATTCSPRGTSPRASCSRSGARGRGASPAVREAAARRIAIPIARGVESLNAAVAVGIAVAVLSRAASSPASPRGGAPRARPRPRAAPVSEPRPPADADAVEGVVVRQDAKGCVVRTADGVERFCSVRGKLHLEGPVVSRTAVVVGDRVRMRPTDAERGSVEGVAARRSVLARPDPHDPQARSG